MFTAWQPEPLVTMWHFTKDIRVNVCIYSYSQGKQSGLYMVIVRHLPG